MSAAVNPGATLGPATAPVGGMAPGVVSQSPAPAPALAPVPAPAPAPVPAPAPTAVISAPVPVPATGTTPPIIQTSWAQWSSDITNTTQKTFIAVVIYASAVFGGIISSNYAITEGDPRRFLSFLYGFAWYPLSLAYAVYDPPEWYATIYPLRQGPPGLFSYPPPAPKVTIGKSLENKDSKALRIMSGILLAANVYVAAVLIKTRFYT